MTKYYLCLLITLASLLKVSAQISFTHLGINDGLSQSTVFDITQDSKGNMWFSTFNGVNKYNGYDFTVYLHEEGNPHSISHNTARTIQAGSNGKVWIGTDEGLSCYDPIEDFFYNYYYEKDKKRVAVTGIIEIDPEHLLVNTSHGLTLFNILQSAFTTDKMDATLL